MSYKLLYTHYPNGQVLFSYTMRFSSDTYGDELKDDEEVIMHIIIKTEKIESKGTKVKLPQINRLYPLLT